jgi:hypothetical protein
VEHIRLITTHISWLILAGQYAYKVKRPVNFGFVDYSTMTRRQMFCQEEMRLNRRLTNGVYLGIVPIVRTNAGVRFGGVGDVIDHAVRMQRWGRRLDSGPSPYVQRSRNGAEAFVGLGTLACSARRLIPSRHFRIITTSANSTSRLNMIAISEIQR